MRKILTFLLTIITLACYSQGTTVTVGGLSGASVANADSLGNQAPAFYLGRVNHAGLDSTNDIAGFQDSVTTNTNVTANTTHRSSDGSNHTFIDQDVTIGSSPIYNNLTVDTIFSGTDTIIISEAAINQRSHADLHASDSSVVLTMTQNNYAHITNASNTLLTSGHIKNITAGGDSLITGIAGLYRVDVHLSINGNANDIYEGVIAIDNVINNEHKVTRKTSNNDVGDMSFSGLYDFTASQSVKMMLRNTANNNNATIVNACLVLNRIDK
ncbi:hypothetical protein LCGC14_0770920 [marine sediment metagenome]|uniref:Uncharacterized protein n=1 Tax=marine sediment metagenome TaxID=412755 RepID=A0A0F9Q2I3_9ZZZZ